ncbi:hypothetical protein IRJ41_009952 [Triplophysa rosa]|uniref:Immunoglobulin subtype domain-containing protein n=1 Tax=Triplophysa rosa TaxID=992332 RepID=A0A9W7THE4_TRIRA|nr:hypothetical protein IRJ41_009952 [Triplophysa rosa]
MGDISIVLLVLLVWKFTAACDTDPDFFKQACKDVTGHVGKELTLNCTVSYSNRCRMVLYKLINKDKETTICREFASKPDQQHFSCTYTANKVMSATFMFSLQANCGCITTTFTVNTGGSNRIKGDPTKETSDLTGKAGIAVIVAAISCFIIFVMGFVLMRKHDKNTYGFQKNCVCDDNIKKLADTETV